MGLGDCKLTAEKLKELEAGLFGNTKQRGFRMRIDDLTKKDPTREYCLPYADDNRRFAEVQGLPIDSEYSIRVYWAPGTNETQKKAIASIITTWSVLGSIGQRSRRGFGSVRLHSGTGFFSPEKLYGNGAKEFPESYATSDDLLQVVTDTVSATAAHQIAYMASLGTSAVNNLANPLNGTVFKDMFVLKSFDQIEVGNELGSKIYDHTPQKGNPDTTGPIARMHGCTGATADEHGTTQNGRLASPLYLRLHKVDNQFVPVAVFSYRKKGDTSDAFSEPFKNWLTDLRLDTLLTRNLPTATALPGVPTPPPSPELTPKAAPPAASPRGWENPAGTRSKPKKRAGKPPKLDTAAFAKSPQLLRILEAIQAQPWLADWTIDENTYSSEGGETETPKYQRFNQMVLYLKAPDGQVNLVLKLTCKTGEQWNQVFTELNTIIFGQNASA